MDWLRMCPEALRDALRRQLPVLIPFGAIEYHGEHLPLGTDTLLAEGFCRRIAEQTECVIAPPIPFAPTLHWAGGEADGDIDFPSEALIPYIDALLTALIHTGFRRIYMMIGHQGLDGMPATLARLALHRVQQRLASSFAPGWGKGNHLPDAAFFSMLHIGTYDTYVDYTTLQGDQPMPVGHGGCGETQLIQALYEGLDCPDARQLNPCPVWLDDLPKANRYNGAYWVALCVDAWVKHLQSPAENKSV
jgi:creatinine amidohydrolase